ncbi:MAG TPA: hypothetical protein VIG33_12520 [Pseudobdellovibrionaceae bacterium]|jgi:hypothetical protein
MFFSRVNTNFIAAVVLAFVSPLVTPVNGFAYSSVQEINEFLAKNECKIKAMNVADNTEKYQRNLNWEIASENSSFFLKKTRVEYFRGHRSHIFVPAPSPEVGVPYRELGVDEEFYIYFDLNNPTDEGASVSDLFIYTNNTFTEVPAKLENFATNEPFSLKFRTQMNGDRYYFFQCSPKN